MRLNTQSYPPELTLRELHLERGDYALRGLYSDVVVRFCGTGWIVVWRDEAGVACEAVRTTDADAFRCANFVAEHGALPVSARRSRVKTLTGLSAVCAEGGVL